MTLKKSKKTFYKKKPPKTQKKPTQLPHINRSISEIPRMYLIGGVWGMAVLTLILLASNILLLQMYFELKNVRTQTLMRLAKAQTLIQEHPDQAEAYYTAAVHLTQVKDYETAKTYLEKALFLNPGMDEAKKLLEQIEVKL